MFVYNKLVIIIAEFTFLLHNAFVTKPYIISDH